MVVLFLNFKFHGINTTQEKERTTTLLTGWSTRFKHVHHTQQVNMQVYLLLAQIKEKVTMCHSLELTEMFSIIIL